MPAIDDITDSEAVERRDTGEGHRPGRGATDRGQRGDGHGQGSRSPERREDARVSRFIAPERDERGSIPDDGWAAVEHMLNEWADVARAIILRRREHRG